MKITTQNGMVFEGTQAEYEAFLAFAERKLAEQEAKESGETIEFEGATYRKVEREAREGDVVMFSEEIANNTTYVTANKPYKVAVIPKGRTVFNTDGGRGTYGVYRDDEEFNRTLETVDVYEPVEQAVKYANKPKLKAGDFVKFKEDGVDIIAGKAYEVFADHNGLYFVDGDGAKRWHHFDFKHEILSAEEAKWAKIGRQPNEYRKGDVVLITSHRTGDGAGNIGTIEDAGIIGEKGVGVRYGTSFAAICFEGESVELLSPVESLFNANA